MDGTTHSTKVTHMNTGAHITWSPNYRVCDETEMIMGHRNPQKSKMCTPHKAQVVQGMIVRGGSTIEYTLEITKDTYLLLGCIDIRFEVIRLSNYGYRHCVCIATSNRRNACPLGAWSRRIISSLWDHNFGVLQPVKHSHTMALWHVYVWRLILFPYVQHVW